MVELEFLDARELWMAWGLLAGKFRPPARGYPICQDLARLGECIGDDAFVEARRDRGTYRNCSKAGVSLREIESLATRTVERLHTRVALGFQFVIFREIQEGNFP